MTGTRKQPARLYVDALLDQPKLVLDVERAHYLGRVLRCREGEHVIVFNARGEERLATIRSLAKRHSLLELGDKLTPLPESPARIILLQALVKSDAMDLVVQKATELGVDRVLATRTEFSVVRLDDDRRERRLEHWRRIAFSACEQSGRHQPPLLEAHATLAAAIAALPPETDRVAFDPDAGVTLDGLTDPRADVCVAIGPEGGFSPGERENLAAAGFTLCALGPRTLRAETAAIAACTALQLLRGDLGQPAM
jgi:16S rRNA (uracil1498-N3)-methyltransferase